MKPLSLIPLLCCAVCASAMTASTSPPLSAGAAAAPPFSLQTSLAQDWYYLSLSAPSAFPGSSILMSWSSGGYLPTPVTQNVTLYLTLIDDDSMQYVIKAATPNTGYFYFTVPNIHPGVYWATVRNLAYDTSVFAPGKAAFTILGPFQVSQPRASTVWYTNASVAQNPVVRIMVGLGTDSINCTVLLVSPSLGINKTLIQGPCRSQRYDGVVEIPLSPLTFEPWIAVSPPTFEPWNATDFYVLAFNTDHPEVPSNNYTVSNSSFFSILTPQFPVVALNRSFNFTTAPFENHFVRIPSIPAAASGLYLSISMEQSIPEDWKYWVSVGFADYLLPPYSRYFNYLRSDKLSVGIYVPIVNESSVTVAFGSFSDKTHAATARIQLVPALWVQAYTANLTIAIPKSSLLATYGSSDGVANQFDKELSSLLSAPRGLVLRKPFTDLFQTSDNQKSRMSLRLMPTASLPVDVVLRLPKPFSALAIFNAWQQAVATNSVPAQLYPLLNASNVTSDSYDGASFCTRTQSFADPCEELSMPSPSTDDKIGLAVGVAVGGTAAVLLVIAAVWYARRVKKQPLSGAATAWSVPSESSTSSDPSAPSQPVHDHYVKIDSPSGSLSDPAIESTSGFTAFVAPQPVISGTFASPPPPTNDFAVQPATSTNGPFATIDAFPTQRATSEPIQSETAEGVGSQ